MKDQFRLFDYAEYGGVPLLGVNGVSIVCHGESSAKAIQKGIGAATRMVRADLVARTARDLESVREGQP